MTHYTQPIFKNHNTPALGSLEPAAIVGIVGFVGFAITALVLIGVPVGIYALLKGKKKIKGKKKTRR